MTEPESLSSGAQGADFLELERRHSAEMGAFRADIAEIKSLLHSSIDSQRRDREHFEAPQSPRAEPGGNAN